MGLRGLFQRKNDESEEFVDEITIVDGQVVSLATSLIDESPTDEPLPEEKNPPDEIASNATSSTEIPSPTELPSTEVPAIDYSCVSSQMPNTLFHLVSAYFIARFKQKFTMLHAQATGAFQGGLVNFCRSLIYNPGSIINRLSEEMYQLYDLVDLRTARHKLDWKISEGIKVLYNLRLGCRR